jgi:hypothetical protein
MNVNLLIDAIVRQTTVLIAQLATTAGVRAPLAHTANVVFAELVRELKEQGLGNKVIADMFGLALSTYHDRVRRLSESQSVRGRSLWEATLSFVQERQTVLQTEVLDRFRHDDEATVRGVLADLVESGLVFRTGRGARTTYRAASPEELAMPDGASTDGTESLVWLVVHRQGPATLAELADRVPVPDEALRAALEGLVADGRVVRSESGGTTRFSAGSCIIPLGRSGGWEAAVFDHYQAMVTALCAKLRDGKARAEAADTVGGSTFGFTVWEGHPCQDEVLGTLGRIRRELGELRQKVHAHNAAHAPPDGTVGVIAYVGQNVIRAEAPEEES